MTLLSTIHCYLSLARLNCAKVLSGFLSLMNPQGIICSPEAFGYVMVSYSRAGKLRHVMRVLTVMQKAGVEPNLSICNTAIYALVKGNKLEKGTEILETNGADWNQTQCCHL